MILPSEYRCQCGAVVYIGNKACPRCRAENPHVGFLVSEPPATDDTLKTYMFDFRDKLMAHNLPWDGPVPVVIEPRGTREPRGGATKPPGAGDTMKTYPASGDNLQGKRRRRR